MVSRKTHIEVWPQEYREDRTCLLLALGLVARVKTGVGWGLGDKGKVGCRVAKGIRHSAQFLFLLESPGWKAPSVGGPGPTHPNAQPMARVEMLWGHQGPPPHPAEALNFACGKAGESGVPVMTARGVPSPVPLVRSLSTCIPNGPVAGGQQQVPTCHQVLPAGAIS